MEKYYFVYKNSQGNWHTATNPVFIAKHTYCRAIPKEVFKDELISDFLYRVNNFYKSELDVKDVQLMQEYDLD